MAVQQLSKLVTTGGLRSPNFFNGRLLTAEDLNAEHEANHRARDWLGQTIGDGIAYGLQVEPAAGSTPAAPVVTVKPGLALNRAGHTLVLNDPADVSLLASAGTAAVAPSPASGTFRACQPPQAGVYVAGAGVYLLVMAPAFGTEGRAQISGLGNVDASCNTKSLIEGVQFRLIQLPIGAAELDDAAHLRNRVAYRSFGPPDPRLVNFALAPFITPGSQYGLLDDLRGAALTDCDIPLALIYWTAHDGIGFIDLWSVRRRVTRGPTTERWPLLVGDRRVGEHEAAFLQFQVQIASLQMGLANPNTARAIDHFVYLPPVGLLPLAASGAPPAFDAATFFTQVAYRSPAFIEGVLVEPLVKAAIGYAPIDLSAGPAVFLYQVRENYDPRLAGGAPYLIFTSVDVPFAGVSRYDISRWEYGKYAEGSEP
jgi:hypothetical protein